MLRIEENSIIIVERKKSGREMHKFKLGFLINVRYWGGRVTTCSSQDNCL